MTALFKFVVLLAIFLLQPMSDPMNEPSHELIRKPTKQSEQDALLPGNLSLKGVCVDLSSGQGGPFPILRLTKACWTYPPPRNLITIIKARLRPTHSAIV